MPLKKYIHCTSIKKLIMRKVKNFLLDIVPEQLLVAGRDQLERTLFIIPSEIWKETTNKMQILRCLLLTSVSTCFGHHYAHLQENKGLVTAFDVLFWFCWMWLVAVVGRCLAGCEHCSHPTTQRPTTATNHIQQNQNNTSNAVTGPLFSWRWA